MAITRAQQYRQMLKDGDFVKQGGVRNYLPSEMVTVPKKAKSSKDHPATELAYITKAEKDLLIKKDLHNSLNGKPNKGPSGVMSLNGDYSDMLGGVTGADISAAERGEGARGAMSQDRANELRAGAVAAGAGAKDTDTDAIRKEAKEIKAASKARAAEAEAAITKEEKKEARLNYKKIKDRFKKDRIARQQRINDILSGKFGINNPYGLSPTELADLKSLGIDPNVEGPMTDIQQDIFDQMMEKNDRFSGVNLENFQNKFDLPTTGITSLDLVTGLLQGPLSKGSKVNKEFFTNKVLDAGKYKYNNNVVNPEIFSMLNPSEMQEIYGDYMDKRMSGETDAYGNPTIPTGIGRDDPNPVSDPCLGPNPPAYCNVGSNDKDDTDPRSNFYGLSPRIGGSIFDFSNLAEGGRVPAMDGGIMDLARQELFLGGIVKGIKKAVRGVKKIAKSPLGKAALIGGLGYLTMGGGAGSFGKFFGKGSFNPFLKVGAGGTSFSGLGSILSKAGLVSSAGLPTFKGGIALTSLLPLLTGKKDEDEFDIDNYYASQQLVPGTTKRQMGSEFDFYNYNLAEGGMPSKEPVAKKVMPLLDMDGMEKDYRAEGGFVPIGRMEKADDVPARLSKNEFVFTADAVRNAGEGDVDKGAEVMYNMMKNLESGGEISEESQGLDGAREMFQTSQRLGEVI